MVKERRRPKMSLHWPRLTRIGKVATWQNLVNFWGGGLIYYLSLFRMPQKVCTRLERIQRQFL